MPAAVQVHVFRGLIGIVIGFAVGHLDGLLPAVSGTAAADDRPLRRQEPLLTGLRPVLAATPAVQSLRLCVQLMLQGLPAPSQKPAINPVLR